MTEPDNSPDLEAIRKSSAAHLALYLETDGEQGGTRHGADVLILTTTGRRSGEARSTPLIYGRDGDRLVIVGSLGGAPRHPYWYLNLLAEPNALVQVMADRFPVRARVAEGEERSRLWPLVTRVYPPYAEYQTRTEREIPLVVLERVQ